LQKSALPSEVMISMRYSLGRFSLFFVLGLTGCLRREVVEQTPTTSNVFIEQVPNRTINEIDLLFVIDNSTSMADKQVILRTAVPQMVRRLVTPRCENAQGDIVSNPGTCPAGYGPEFRPVNDIHIGVISSSLGDHGIESVCARDEAGRNNNDRSLLLPRVRPDLPDPGGTGFLSWNGGGPDQVAELVSQFESHVVAAGEVGCGYEAPLEAFYRFLIDPAPPLSLSLNDKGHSSIGVGADGSPLVDHEVLAQRQQFLRPEGLVAIVLLTDENDCSAMDGGVTYDYARVGHLVGRRPDTGMPAASPICSTNPNDRCCHSCFVDPPSGCDPNACSGDPKVPDSLDRANVRCFANQERFGLDLLYPVERYVKGLSSRTVVDDHTGQEVDNPLLRSASGRVRDPKLVFFAGIVGVPWQDVATRSSLTEPDTMALLNATELTEENVSVDGRMVSRWDLILGEPGLPVGSGACDGEDARCGAVPIAPLDPFMIESIDPRPVGATNPITGDLIVGPESNNPYANAINGHEVNHNAIDARYRDDLPARDDLQYACIFPFERPKPDCLPGDDSCDCGSEPDRNRPLCQAPEVGAPAGTTQYFGKAYPGTRILQVLRDFGANSIVGSICPKITQGSVEDPDYGYNPAVQAIVDRLADTLKGTCLPRELSVDEEGLVPCVVVETMRPDVGTLTCDAPGRSAVRPELIPTVRSHLESTGICGGRTEVTCESMQMCAINQLTLEPREECLQSLGEPSTFPVPGFCYIDPEKQNEAGEYVAGGDANGNNPNVDDCPSTGRRILRFVGADTPAAETTTFVACLGEAQSADPGIPPAPPAGDDGESGASE
jgi:hypothetical protein